MQTTILLDNCVCKFPFLPHILTNLRGNHFISAKCILMTLQIPLQLIVGAGMGPILALKYFRYTYRPSKINILQQVERMGGPILSIGSIEPQARSLEKDVSPLSITQPKNRNPVFEPLLSDSPNTRRSFGSGTPFDFFQSQSRLSLSYTRNCKDN